MTANVTGDAGLQDRVLEDLEGASNYRRWLCELAAPHLGDDPIEIGSGSGRYALEWASRGLRITASEAEPARLEGLRARLGGHPQIQVRQLQAPLTETGNYSAVVACNVLEHIQDDVTALRSFAGLLRPGGNVVLLVPAFAWAMSDFDRAVGHQRRYTVASLRSALEAAGLQVRSIHYVNWAGLLAWVVMMKWLRGRPKAGAMLWFGDRVLVPLVRWTERLFRPPFGQSIFAVASCATEKR